MRDFVPGPAFSAGTIVAGALQLHRYIRMASRDMLNRLIFALLFLGNISVCLAGAWGAGSFENDSALDWANENITEATSLNVLKAAFATVQASGYIDVDACSAAIAAAEIVASINVNEFENLPGYISIWAKRNQSGLDKALLTESLNAVTICEDNKRSELAQLWGGALYDKWKKKTEYIKHRLK